MCIYATSHVEQKFESFNFLPPQLGDVVVECLGVAEGGRVPFPGPGSRDSSEIVILVDDCCSASCVDIDDRFDDMEPALSVLGDCEALSSGEDGDEKMPQPLQKLRQAALAKGCSRAGYISDMHVRGMNE